MKKRRKIYLALFIVASIVYVLNNIVLKKITSGVLHYFFVSYFNDLLCPFVFLSYSNIILIIFNKELIKLKQLLKLSICAGIIWEYITPLIKKGAVADFVDICCYIISTIIFWMILRLRN